MKTKTCRLLFIIAGALLALPLLTVWLKAQGVEVADGVTVNVADGKFDLANSLIALIAPLVTAGVKLLWPKIPAGLIPVVCAAAGLLLAIGSHYIAGLNVTWWQGLLLGIAGIGVREIVDRGRQAVVPPSF
jgi:hypothetical protein